MDIYGPSLRKTLMALLLCAVVVTICYFWIDRSVAIYIHEHTWNRIPIFQWLTVPPPVLQTWAPLVLIVCMIRRAWRPFQRWELTVVAACVSLILGDQFKESLAFVFGRSWPETWVNNNPSLMSNGTFGFHLFHGSEEFSSFPSGHMARMGGAAAVVWIVYPRWRCACILTMMAVATGLLGMNYHFTGDIVAGGFVGGIVGTYTTWAFGLMKSQVPQNIHSRYGETR